MATDITFGGKRIKEPGVYSRIISGINNPPLSLDYGKILIIDTGSLAGYGAGRGISGENAEKGDAIYRGIKTVTDLRDFFRGGKMWDLAPYFFKPSGFGVNGASEIDIVRCATTEASQISWTFTGGGANGGTLSIDTVDEGLCSVGAENDDDVLKFGYASTMHAGVVDTNKFLWRFWRGTYRGVDGDGNPYDRAEADVTPELLVESPEFDNIDDLEAWMLTDYVFNMYFTNVVASKAGTGAIDSGDLTTYAGNNLSAGGTETYNATDVDLALEYLLENDCSLIFCDKGGSASMGASIDKIMYWITSVSKYPHIMIVGGGDDSTEFTAADGSQDIAEYFDIERVVVVHGGIKISDRAAGTGYRLRDSMYHAAFVTGRLAGLAPQVPLTYKSLGFDGVRHVMSTNERGLALDSGILHSKYDDDFQQIVVNQGINSLQDNDYTVNNDGQSHLIQIVRIKDQLNKEIQVNAKKQLLGSPTGTNRNTLSEQDVKDWLDGYLKMKLASKISDNLILGYQNITVERVDDYYKVNYEFIPNGEINKLLFTGVIIN